MAVQHNTARDLALKEFYPEGSSLTADRTKLAQTVFNPAEVDKWLEKGVNRSDIRHFDTPDAREPTQQEIRSRLRSQIGLGYVESEPERFLREGQVTRKLLEKVKDNISSYESFKAEVAKAWKKDRSLEYLVKNMGESDYQALYKQPLIKKWMEGNTQETIISGLMQRYNIERGRAEATYGNMNEDAKSKFLSALFTGRRVRLSRHAMPEGEPLPEFTPAQGQVLRQRSRSGQEYSRQKPVKWSDMEVTFLRANRQMRLNALTSLHNSTFSNRRTPSSISNKRQRLPR